MTRAASQPKVCRNETTETHGQTDTVLIVKGHSLCIRLNGLAKVWLKWLTKAKPQEPAA